MKKIVSLFLSLGLVSVLGTTALVYAATNYNPKVKADGNKINTTIVPEFKENGASAEVVNPIEIKKEEENPEKEEYVPFIPEIYDDDPFIDIDVSRDFSTQYNYSGAVLSPKNGTFTEEDGVYTASAPAISANLGSETPFPYGTISADIVNNGTDTGLIFGLSSTSSTFWEGNGISYYFAFISQDGLAYLAKTDNGTWAPYSTINIPGYDPLQTYELKILYRVDRILMFINDELYVNFSDQSPLTGTGWGIRSGGNGAQIGNISISSKATL